MSLPHKRYRRRPLLSADAIAGNDDLMTEILIRLPAKSLCRFKCVSKRWYSLISYPHFSLLRMPHSVSGLLYHVNTLDKRIPKYKYVHLSGKRTRSAPFKSLCFGDDHLTIIHSCNGLLLCSSTANSTEIHKNNYYICNPTTKQFASIPPPPSRIIVEPTAPPFMNLAFDLSRSSHYRIILLHYLVKLGYQIEIYSSDTHTWRPSSGVPFPAKAERHFTNGVFLNGTIHWASFLSQTSLRFDVDRECLETMPMPPFRHYIKFRDISYFGESRGHLHLICGSIFFSTPLEIFEMESDYSNWFVKYRISVDAIIKKFPLNIVRGELEEESYLLLCEGGTLVSYNFHDKTLKKICNSFRPVNFDVHQYIETLFQI